MEPACEVNKKGTRAKLMVLSSSDNTNILVYSDEGSFVVEDWNEAEQDDRTRYKSQYDQTNL